MNPSKVLKLAIPAAGILLIGGVVLLRSRSSEAPLPAAGPSSKPAAVRVERPVYSSPLPPPPPKLAPADQVAKGMEDARLQSTYQNFRNAVASGNTVLEDALRKVLARDRQAALKMAQDEVARANAPLDREIAAKTLESLRK